MVPRTAAAGLTAERIRLWGVVQGVGLRPYTARMAQAWRLRGAVRNRGGLVEIIALAGPARLDGFLKAFVAGLPVPAQVIRQTREAIARNGRTQQIGVPGRGCFCLRPSGCPGGDDVRASQLPAKPFRRGTGRFQILESDPLPGLAFPSPDLPVCPDCLADMDDPGNRRHRHALVSCMACGPRFSIMQSLPYDRSRTSLAGFGLCSRCRQEYGSLADRRHHAQTISCLDCGPQLGWQPGPAAASGLAAACGPAAAFGLASTPAPAEGEAALKAAIAAIQAGQVVAVKGIGGYHLACDPASDAAVADLRRIKDRDRKPFAVMYPDLEALVRHAAPTPAEVRLLQSPARPIVLVRRRSGQLAGLSADVCGRSAAIGAFLPCAPLQVLLLRACGPLVMTSANPSDEPIIFCDTDMQAFAAAHPTLAGILTHDRPILRGLDDSVARLAGERPILIRRSRGYVPLAIDLGEPTEPVARDEGLSASTEPVAPDSELMPGLEPVVLATGGDLKATFAVVHRQFAWLSAPVGDLGSLAVHERWLAEQRAFCDLLRLQPTLAVTDLHPGYVSRQLAEAALPGEPAQPGQSALYRPAGQSGRAAVSGPKPVRAAFQHHEAHVASVLAEHQLKGAALGLAFDGTGFGHDGSIWGGEGLLIDAAGCRRLGGLRPTRLPGGDTGMREAWRPLLGFLLAAGLDPDSELDRATLFPGQPDEALDWLTAAWRQGVGCQNSSSMGRLFDAVSAALGLSDRNDYEGECGSLLEDCARAAADAGLAPWPLRFGLVRSPDGLLQADPDPLWAGVLAARRQGIPAGAVALGFHEAVVTAGIALLAAWAGETGVRTVALSGGVFQNALLAERFDCALRGQGFAVYWNEQVPPNDGGICLGQAWLALREQRSRQQLPA